jgi:hypothetical protein
MTAENVVACGAEGTEYLVTDARRRAELKAIRTMLAW